MKPIPQPMPKTALWHRYCRHLWDHPSIGLRLDVSRMRFSDSFFADMALPIEQALTSMGFLEAGGIANPDEQRMVGHYWLRNPLLAPTSLMRNEILHSQQSIFQFVEALQNATIHPPKASSFAQVLLIGIGGSALGPQFLNQSLGKKRNGLPIYFLDNTDPDGIDDILNLLKDRLDSTLCIVISKSGTTKETRNGMLEVWKAYHEAGMSFSDHAVAITSYGSELESLARNEEWIEIFPLWDWIGGRTSLFSVVGLLPAALNGIDVRALIEGAATMDEITRSPAVDKNPALLIALMWHHAFIDGKDEMVVLPYKDRLSSLSLYLQQLIMESLGKDKNLLGESVETGLVVYGNKGSTDQHAYVQQLRDGLSHFFVLFVEVLKDRESLESLEVEPGITSGDYLNSFLWGTREALYEKNRDSITLTLNEVNESTIGALIALFERSVGYYASFLQINPYHQPGVEAGKKAAASVLLIQQKICDFLKSSSHSHSLFEIAEGINQSQSIEIIFKIIEHLTLNQRILKEEGSSLFEAKYTQKDEVHS